MNKQWEMEFDIALHGALCLYRDRMLKEAEPQAGEHFPVSGEFYRKMEALSGVTIAMQRRRRSCVRKKALWKGALKVAVAALFVFVIAKAGVFPMLPSDRVAASPGQYALEWYEDHVRIVYNPMSDEELAKIDARRPEEFVLGYLPEGLSEVDRLVHPGLCLYVYRNEEKTTTLSFSVCYRNGKTLSGGLSSTSTIMDNEHTTFTMICEDGRELIWAQPVGLENQNGSTLLWTQNNCEFSLDLVTEEDIDIFEIYRSVTVKKEEK